MGRPETTRKIKLGVLDYVLYKLPNAIAVDEVGLECATHKGKRWQDGFVSAIR